jgi:hypothetical protein
MSHGAVRPARGKPAGARLAAAGRSGDETLSRLGRSDAYYWWGLHAPVHERS